MRAIVTATALAVVAGGAGPARACKCDYPSVASRIESADVVFQGRLLETTEIRVDERSWDFGPRGLLTKFEVENVWKGDVGSTIAVLTSASSCMVPLGMPGRSAVVAASIERAYLTTHQCSGLNGGDENEALAILGPPRRSFGAKDNRALFADAGAEDAPHLRGLRLGAGFLLGAAVASTVFAFSRKRVKGHERR
jgi:hypothetical protein